MGERSGEVDATNGREGLWMQYVGRGGGWQGCGRRRRGTKFVVKKNFVVHLPLTRNACIASCIIIQPLQVVPSLACSVASLSHSPGHQLSDYRNLHHSNLTDYLLASGDSSDMPCMIG